MRDLFDQGKYEPKNKSVHALINEFESKYKEPFESAKTFWNQNIREFHRDVTGLKLDRRNIREGRGTTVNIRFRPDEDDTFIRLIDEYYPDLDFDEYSKLRELHESLLSSKRYFESSQYKAEFERLLGYCDEYFKRYDLDRMLTELFKGLGNSKDVWGAYYYADSHIEIYYVPLIIFTGIMRLNLEYAVVVTLAHELAHAYHHVGLDTDGSTWKRMDSADKEIVEGLAQYYTYLFVTENEHHHPGVRLAYDRMLSCQSGPYVVHVPWTRVYKREHVKHAFNVTRRTNIEEFASFEQLLKEAKDRLK